MELRKDLELLPPDKLSGDETRWLLRDLSNNRYFKLGQTEVRILNSLRRLGASAPDVSALCQQISEELNQDENEVRTFIEFLAEQQLLQSSGKEARDHLLSKADRENPSGMRYLLRNYLFLKFHLFKPNTLLDRLLPITTWLFKPWFWQLVFLNTVIGFYLTSRQMDVFFATFIDNLTWQGIASAAAALIVVKVIHEFGHGLVARRYGCSVDSMGVALMVFWPVLYTDTTDSWRLQDKRQRALISVSGILAELLIASICF